MSFNKESFERMKEARRLPFLKRNMTVDVAGRTGKVIGNYGHNLLVKFEGYKISSNCHPWWKVKYFDTDGSLIIEYGE